MSKVKKSKKAAPSRLGSRLDDFLLEEGLYEETQARAIKEVVAWQLAEAMKVRKLSRSRLAVLLKTSRTQVGRLLDPRHDITLSSLQRAAKLVGRKVRLELV
jgi:antitoxin HicB